MSTLGQRQLYPSDQKRLYKEVDTRFRSDTPHAEVAQFLMNDHNCWKRIVSLTQEVLLQGLNRRKDQHSMGTFYWGGNLRYYPECEQLVGALTEFFVRTLSQRSGALLGDSYWVVVAQHFVISGWVLWVRGAVEEDQRHLLLDVDDYGYPLAKDVDLDGYETLYRSESYYKPDVLWQD